MNVVVEGAILTQVDPQTLDMGGHFYWVGGGVKGGVMFDVLLFSTPKQLKLVVVERHVVVLGPGVYCIVADPHPQLWIQSC